jgi:periplasmic divalent cation tolerance protein
MDSLLVVTSLPDRESAEKLAVLLIERHLAACVNILAPCASVYRWQGEIQHDEEYPLLIKTVKDRYAELEASIRANHPYELPEIIAVPIADGLPAYLQWIESETQHNDERA